jgi:hypothetical protein
MKKNYVMFFGAAVVCMIADFAASQAHAYAVGSVAPEVPTPASLATTSSLSDSAAGGSSYNFGNSLQGLLSPFTGFINSLQLNNNTTANTNGVSFTWPTVNMTPVLESTFQNTLSQWFNEFDVWFYSVTGVQLSGILVAILNLFSWVLGLAQQAVNWLLGVFH